MPLVQQRQRHRHAQPDAPTTVAGASVQMVMSSEGQTTLTFAATDDAGLTESSLPAG